MAVLNSLCQLLYILTTLFFIECFVFLESDFIEQFHTLNIFHNKVNVFGVIVSFEVLNDVGVVQSIE